jgi:hypothetical protein
MRPVRPKLDAHQAYIAGEQPEYLQVTAAFVAHPSYPARDTPSGLVNTTVLAFKPSAEELAQLNAGEAIYVALLTGGGPMQPIMVFAGARAAADVYGVEVEA